MSARKQNGESVPELGRVLAGHISTLPDYAVREIVRGIRDAVTVGLITRLWEARNQRPLFNTEPR